MRLLLDESLPRRLRHSLPAYSRPELRDRLADLILLDKNPITGTTVVRRGGGWTGVAAGSVTSPLPNNFVDSFRNGPSRTCK